MSSRVDDGAILAHSYLPPPEKVSFFSPQYHRWDRRGPISGVRCNAVPTQGGAWIMLSKGKFIVPTRLRCCKFRYVPLCGQHGRDFMRQQVASAHLFKLICSFPAHGDRPASKKMLPNLFKSGDAPNSCSCVNMLGVRQECELSKALRCAMC